jgi:hypothetical protein
MNDAFTDPLGYNKQDDAADAHFAAQAKAQFDSIMTTAAIYNTPAGKLELARLRAATIESAAWMPSIALQHGMEAATAHAFAREGQNALVRDIENRIELAKKVSTPEDLQELLKGGQ